MDHTTPNVPPPSPSRHSLYHVVALTATIEDETTLTATIEDASPLEDEPILTATIEDASPLEDEPTRPAAIEELLLLPPIDPNSAKYNLKRGLYKRGIRKTPSNESLINCNTV